MPIRRKKFAEYHLTDVCRFAECHFAEFRLAKCRFAWGMSLGGVTDEERERWGVEHVCGRVLELGLGMGRGAGMVDGEGVRGMVRV